MVRIEAIKSDITNCDNLDAIVNAAKPTLLGGSGVDGAVHAAAGPELLEECKKLGGCRTGGAVITGAHNLKNKYIIHAVGPRWNGGNAGEAELLKSAYCQALVLAEKHKIRSLAFPSLSTGVYGYPIEEAADIATKAVWEYCEKNPDAFDYICWAMLNEQNRKVYEDAILRNKPEEKTEDIIGFHRVEEDYGCFSNWYHAEFDIAGQHYVSSEQYMMYRKVMLGRDFELAAKIMATKDPAEAKKYGSGAYFKNYDTIRDMWKKNGQYIVKCGIRAKFVQNLELLTRLLETGDALLCECSGNDKVWGIGIDYDDPAWRDVRNWKGSNHLGIILMELRREFRQEISLFGAVLNNDYRDIAEKDVWDKTAGYLKRFPEYYLAIHAYADQLPKGNIRNHFYYGCTLNELEKAMLENMGGGLPLAGFYEMKQEIHDIYRRKTGK